VKACLKNDKAAQKWLFDTYAKQMLGLCYRYVNDYDLAHDLMQDSFIKVFEKLETYRAESPLKSWIRKIMVNTCLGHIRKQKKFTTH
jgi:RNA polymerase sigma-70 factor (ECF subfamily)